MENITISIRRFEELLYKEAAYEMKKKELMGDKYVSMLDRVLFGIPEEPAASVADNDF